MKHSLSRDRENVDIERALALIFPFEHSPFPLVRFRRVPSITHLPALRVSFAELAEIGTEVAS